jgi:3-methyl-2-oxobutanoate hydroxymethyltransferase
MSSHVDSKQKKFSVVDLVTSKQNKKKISAITCYDAAFATLINKTGIDIVLVGDSLGNVILGRKNTVSVTLQEMIHHTAAVASTLNRAWLVADMPFMSYQISPEDALKNAAALVQQGGAEAVKLEGDVSAQIAKIVHAGIPVVAHLGLTPQSVHAQGGYRVQGRSASARQNLLDSALRLEDAGACSLVLELIPEDLGQELSTRLKIPTIGIGAGRYCDGQILVLHDMLGFHSDFRPKFLKTYANLDEIVVNALEKYNNEVQSGSFPDETQVFKE